MNTLIGRKRELEILKKISSSDQAEFVTIYGRRRVGKTYLIQQSLSQAGIYLECTGLKDGHLKDQLFNFTNSFKAVFCPHFSLQPPANWHTAFEWLTTEAKHMSKNQKLIVFLDELPWLATQRSFLLQQLDYFWNTQWNQLPNFKLIVCGSAASWMLNHLINAKGGLYNRLTKTILLEPFTLAETKQFLDKKGVELSYKQILDIYLVTGGIPYYLAQFQNTQSIIQNIDALCFKKDGLLYSEFSRLFKSLFDASDLNLRIIRHIAQYRYGISFTELIKKVGKSAGGRFAERLNELEAAGFIQAFLPYGRKKRDRYYQVIDEYSLFYLHWIEPMTQMRALQQSGNYWANVIRSSSWHSWAGFAFEGVCYKHADKIIQALGLEGIACIVGCWRSTKQIDDQQTGAQIDLLFDRSDNAITLCEIKYSTKPFVIDKNYARVLINKLEIFSKQVNSSKQLFLAMITTEGLHTNIWSKKLVNGGVVTLEQLF